MPACSRPSVKTAGSPPSTTRKPASPRSRRASAGLGRELSIAAANRRRACGRRWPGEALVEILVLLAAWRRLTKLGDGPMDGQPVGGLGQHLGRQAARASPAGVARRGALAAAGRAPTSRAGAGGHAAPPGARRRAAGRRREIRGVFAALRTSTRAGPSRRSAPTRASTAGPKCPPATGTNSVLHPPGRACRRGGLGRVRSWGRGPLAPRRHHVHLGLPDVRGRMDAQVLEEPGVLLGQAGHDLVVGARDQDLVGLGEAHDPLGDVDPVAEHVGLAVDVLHDPERAEVDADPEGKLGADGHGARAQVAAANGRPGVRESKEPPVAVSSIIRSVTGTCASTPATSPLSRVLSSTCWVTRRSEYPTMSMKTTVAMNVRCPGSGAACSTILSSRSSASPSGGSAACG